MMKTAFSLRYQDIHLGTGPVAEPNKLYKVLYTGWRAADGVKFDSTDDHPRPPVVDKDGKPVLDADGKPKQGDIQPMAFPQGMGRLIPGFDQGVAGMRIGGKRRLFIPWQMAYGTHAIPDHGPGHPGIPAKSDLIFDVTLVAVDELPAPPARPGMGAMPGRPNPNAPHPMPNGAPGSALGAAPVQPGSPATAPAPGAAPAPATAPAPASPGPASAAPPSAAPAAPATTTPKPD
jgi:peptidylprolyl isomerase